MSDPSVLTLVLPGALPSAPIAAELARQLEAPDGPAPTLVQWLRRARVVQAAFDPDDAGCTATEAWFFARAGFASGHAGLRPGAALASLLVPDEAAAQAAEPVWVAELAHVQVGRDGLVLTDPGGLRVDAAESAALLDSARGLFDEAGFGVEPAAPGRWRVRPPSGVGVPAATPAVVAGTGLDRWWPRDAGARPWRRLVNEIQMTWHEHPVNLDREARGEVAVNGLWLHGGAPAWTPRWQPAPARLVGGPPWLRALAGRAGLPWSPAGASAVDVSAASVPPVHDPAAHVPACAWEPGTIAALPDLDVPCRDAAWAEWLDALRRLQRDCFAPLARRQAAGELAAIELVLPAAQRIVTARIDRRPALLRWLPAPRHDWKTWWLRPAS
ncbi:hypothetical protein GCM10023144_28340 [Pigmentiphaga soli]|uniref:Regulatory protein, RpfE type n=1 Tax=Pigmentiphaga soli TaxID=1007095 RepID=A0ABP8H6X7_9BURK